MKKNVLLSMAACSAALITGLNANAQEVVVEETDVVAVSEVPCKTHYYSDAKDNWFIQIGCSIQLRLRQMVLAISGLASELPRRPNALGQRSVLQGQIR